MTGFLSVAGPMPAVYRSEWLLFDDVEGSGRAGFDPHFRVFLQTWARLLDENVTHHVVSNLEYFGSDHLACAAADALIYVKHDPH